MKDKKAISRVGNLDPERDEKRKLKGSKGDELTGVERPRELQEPGKHEER